MRLLRKFFLREQLTPQVVFSQTESNDFLIQGSDSYICIPAGITVIGARAFQGNLLLNSVLFSESVKEIQESAFEGCSNLSNITSCTSVEFFRDFCFRGTNLTEITIGPNVIHVGKYCFSSIHNLKAVHYHSEKDLVLNCPFSNCPCLDVVEMERNYFYPAAKSSLAVTRSSDDNRPTYADAFPTTPFIRKIRKYLLDYYKRGVCPDCESKMKRKLFRQKCLHCHIVLKRPAK